jgi:hypothetical protein
MRKDSCYEFLVQSFLRRHKKRKCTTDDVLTAERETDALAAAFLIGFERVESGAGWDVESRKSLSQCAAELLRRMSHNEIKATQRQFMRCFPQFFWLMSSMRTLYLEMPYADTVLPMVRRLADSPAAWTLWARNTPVGVGNILSMAEFRQEFESACRMQLHHSKPPQDPMWHAFLQYVYNREDEHGKLVWQQNSIIAGFIQLGRETCESSRRTFWVADFIADDTTEIRADGPPQATVIASIVRLSDECSSTQQLLAIIKGSMSVWNLDSVHPLARSKVASKLQGRCGQLIKNSANLERRGHYQQAVSQLQLPTQAELLWTVAVAPELCPRHKDDERMHAKVNGQVPGPYPRFVASLAPGFDAEAQKRRHSERKRYEAKQYYAIAQGRSTLERIEERFKAIQWGANQETARVRLACEGIDAPDGDVPPEYVDATLMFPVHLRDNTYLQAFEDDIAWKRRLLQQDMDHVQKLLAAQSRSLSSAEDWSAFAERRSTAVPWSKLKQYFRDFHLWVRNCSILNWDATFGSREIVVAVAATATRQASAVHFFYLTPEQAFMVFCRVHLPHGHLGASSDSTSRSSKLLMVYGFSFDIKKPPGVRNNTTAADVVCCPGCQGALVTPTFSARDQDMRCLFCHFQRTGAFCVSALGCCEYPGADALHGSTPIFWIEDDPELLFVVGNYHGAIGDTNGVDDDDVAMFTERRFEHDQLTYVCTSSNTCFGSEQSPRQGGTVVCSTSLWPRDMAREQQDLGVPVQVVSHGTTTSLGIVPTAEGVRKFFAWLLLVGLKRYAKYVVAARNNGLSMASLRRAFCIFLAERSFAENDFTGACDAHEAEFRRVATSYAKLQALTFADADIVDADFVV